jgi:rod shape-determining protein MreC
VASSRRSRRPRTTLILLVLASITIITLDARGGFHRITSGARSVASDAFAPVRSGVDDIIEPVGSFLAGAVHYGAVRQQNQKLQAEIDQLKQQQRSQADIDQAQKQLNALLNLTFGVQLGMPVVGGGGLVGQVVQANHSTSTVRLVTDGQSSVGVRFGPAPGTLAVLAGQGSGKPLNADFVGSNTPLTDGEQFVTSGLQGAVYPAGIPVAKVVSSKNKANSSQESVTLQPLADLAHLRYVSVVLYGPSS